MSVPAAAVGFLRTGAARRLRDHLARSTAWRAVARSEALLARFLRTEEGQAARILPALAGEELERLAPAAARLRADLVARAAGKVGAALERIGQDAFRALVGLVRDRWRKLELETLRGWAAEYLVKDLPELKALLARLEARVARREGWRRPELVRDLVTADGRAWGDWTVISVSEDGKRLWVMAVIESKSISNARDLADMKRSGFGQFLWDWLRARSMGLKVPAVEGPGLHFDPPEIVAELPGPHVNPERDLYTEYVAFTPRGVGEAGRRKLAAQGFALAQGNDWVWPVDPDTLSELLQLIRRADR